MTQANRAILGLAGAGCFCCRRHQPVVIIGGLVSASLLTALVLPAFVPSILA